MENKFKEEDDENSSFSNILRNSFLFILGSIFVFVPILFEVGPPNEATGIWRVPIAQPFILLLFLFFVFYYLLIIKNNILKIKEPKRVIYFLILLSSYIGLHTFLLCIGGCVSLWLLFYTFPVFLIILPIVLIFSPIIDKFLSSTNSIVIKNNFTNKVVIIFKEIFEKVLNTPTMKILLSSVFFVLYMFYKTIKLENFKSGYTLYAPISDITIFLIFFSLYCFIIVKNISKIKRLKGLIRFIVFIALYITMHFFLFLLAGFLTFILCIFTLPIAIILFIIIEIIVNLKNKK